MRTIYDFKQGDRIVRISPSKPYFEGVRDRSYMGAMLIFIGIANGQIFLRRTDDFSIRIFGDKLLNLDLDLWDDGWDYWVDPAELEGNTFMNIDVDFIKSRIEEAVSAEDYETAERWKQKLNDKNLTLDK